jgi:hypothetical protein
MQATEADSGFNHGELNVEELDLDNKSLFELVLRDLGEWDAETLRESKSYAEFRVNALRVLMRQRKNELQSVWRSFEILELDHNRSIAELASLESKDRLDAIRKFSLTENAKFYDSTKGTIASCLRWFASAGIPDCGKLAESIELGRPVADLEERIVTAFHSIEKWIDGLNILNCPAGSKVKKSLEQLTAEKMDHEKYFAIVSDGFDGACQIVHEQNKVTEGGLLLAIKQLETLKATQAPKGFWEQWPKQPTTFGSYYRSGMSALGVAKCFSESVFSMLHVAKVTHFGMPDLFKLEDHELALLAQETVEKLRDIIDFEEWSGVKRFRDIDLMKNKIYMEWQEFSQIINGASERRIHSSSSQVDNLNKTAATVDQAEPRFEDSHRGIVAVAQTEPLDQKTYDRNRKQLEDKLRELFHDELKRGRDPKKRAIARMIGVPESEIAAFVQGIEGLPKGKPGRPKGAKNK